MNRSTKRILVSIVFVAGMVGAVGANDKTYKPDPWITMKTKLALLTDGDVSGTEINVDTVNGHVTLHGKVDTTAEKNRATEVARGIDGTAEVRNLLQVVSDAKKPAMDENDDAIKSRVDAALDKDNDLKSSNIKVKSVNKGVVLLSGKATTMSDHLRAVQTARGVKGVRRVATEVDGPTHLTERDLTGDMTPAMARASDKSDKNNKDYKSGSSVTESASDSWITSATKLRLLANDTTPALQINVDTDHGVVTLFGVVPTEAAKKAAEVEASKVSGVKSVVNALQVVPESVQEAVAVNDDDAEKAAETALNGLEELKNVDVEVKNGVARLTGTVPASTDRLHASLVVRSARGVRSVHNDVTVAN